MKKTSSVPIFVKDEQDFNRVKKEYVIEKTRITYICTNPECGREYTIGLAKARLPLLCRACNMKSTLINNFGSIDNARAYSNTKRNQTILKNYGSIDTFYEKAHENAKKTNLEKYGVENPMQDDNIRDKACNTMEQKYGVRHYSQTDEYNHRVHETSIKRFGVEHFLQADSVRNKIKSTNLEKLGVENPMQNESVKQKVKETCLNKYGSTCVLSPESSIYGDIKQSIRKKYGVDNVFQNEHIKNLIKATNLKKYGVENPSQNKELYAKARNTCKERYGTEYYIQSIDNFKKFTSKFLFNGIYFDSSWELYFYIYNLMNNVPIEHESVRLEYEFNGKKHFYYPDFKINNNLYEIKGHQFIKENGEMYNPYDDSEKDLSLAKQKCAIENNVIFITKNEINKYISYVDEHLTKDFVKLFKTNIAFPYPNVDLSDKSDYGVIKHFHKSIYSAHRYKKPSPLEAWADKSLVLKSAVNRLNYVSSCRPTDVIQGFNVAKIAPKVSVFKPTLAESLIMNYIPNADVIIDPFSGFSGRMLGTYNCGKKYIGFDINEEHVKESNEIIDYKSLGTSCTVEKQDLNLFIEKDWSYLGNVCLFTCPPYGYIEQWGTEDTEKSCDEWIDLCIEKHKGCKGYLFVVDSTEKYKENIVDTLINRSHFGSNTELVIFINP